MLATLRVLHTDTSHTQPAEAPIQGKAAHGLSATRPDLEDPRLKTIGLAGVLERLIRLLPEFPIDDKARKRMVSVRNGAMHVGTSSASRVVLLDYLTVCRTLLEHLEQDVHRFY